MDETHIPDRVTNKDLFAVILESEKARTAMKNEILNKLDGFEKNVEHRLTKLEACVDGHQDDIDNLKKRDFWNGGLSALLAAIAAWIGFSK